MENSIERIFQKSAEELHINPHPKTWSKLSKRLGEVNRLHRKIRRLNRIIKVAASVILLVNIAWLAQYIRAKTKTYDVAQLEDYRPSKKATLRPVIYRPTAATPVHMSRTHAPTPEHSPASGKIKYLNSMLGTWKLAEEFVMANAAFIPERLHVFHTADGHYYLQAGRANTDAYLLHVSNEDGQVKVMHPGVRRIEIAHKAIILYLANGLILEYQQESMPSPIN